LHADEAEKSETAYSRNSTEEESLFEPATKAFQMIASAACADQARPAGRNR
jgi:hypothetical protein